MEFICFSIVIYAYMVLYLVPIGKLNISVVCYLWLLPFFLMFVCFFLSVSQLSNNPYKFENTGNVTMDFVFVY
uniref:Uncharacterized protein n=1 Tax=Rhizophora mucronata TaxID=61149 RepID=A0A2P2QRI1_RHIMU